MLAQLGAKKIQELRGRTVVSRTQQKQINIRLDDTTLELIDECRAELRADLGTIPTRSDVVRKAIEEYLRRSGKHPPKAQ